MKRKIEKKLVVNKETIVNLKNEELSSVNGGAASFPFPCTDTFWGTLCCPTTP